MADLLDHKITRLSNASVSLPRWHIEGRLVDSDTQQKTLADFTGSNAIVFPQVLAQLSLADRDELVEMLTRWILAKRYPGAF